MLKLAPSLFRVAPALVLAFLPGPVAAQPSQTDEIVQTAVVLSADEASLELELLSGRSLQIRLIDGALSVNGSRALTYQPGGLLEAAWRNFLRRASDESLGAALAELAAAEVGSDATARAEILEALEPFVAGSNEIIATAEEPAAAAAVSAAVEVQAESAVEVATAIAAAAGAAQAEALREMVEGGLVIQLTELGGLATSLGRIGLAPELARLLQDSDAPLRIVLEADEYLLPEGAQLNESLLLVETDGVVAGTVTGNVLVADGSLRITSSGRIEGEVVAIDASVTNEGTVVGGLRDVGDFAPVIVAPAVQRVHVRGRSPGVLGNVWNGLGSLAKTIAMYLFFGFLGALIVYFFRGHLETVSDTASYSFGRSFLAGVAAEILVIPIGLVLAILIVTLIAVPFYLLSFGLLGLLGYIAVAHAAGENLTRRRFSWPHRMRRSNSYYYVLNGLGVLLALFVGAAITEMAYPLLGWAHDLLIASAWILTWVAATSGLGAAVLSRAGTRRTYARPQELPEIPVDTLRRMEPIERRERTRTTERGASDES